MSAPLRYRAAIFDLDGTLTDNMPFHRLAYRQFQQRHNLPLWTDEQQAQLDGMRNDQILPIIFGHAISADDLARYADEKESYYRTLSAGELRPVAGLGTLLDAFESRGVVTAVATSAPRENVSFSLEQIGFATRLRFVVRGDEVAHGKPAPDIFLEAARRLGVAASECLVFEDAYAGIEAAHAAGMDCVALTTTNSAEKLHAHGLATMIVANFSTYIEQYGKWLLSTNNR